MDSDGRTYRTVTLRSPSTVPDAEVHYWTPPPLDFSAITRAYIGDTVDGVGQWYDMTVSPPVPCDPPEGWVQVGDHD